MPVIRHFRQIMGDDYAVVLRVQKLIEADERKGIPWEKTKSKIDKEDYLIWEKQLRECRHNGWYRPRLTWLETSRGREEVLTFMSLYPSSERHLYEPKAKGSGPTKEEIKRWEKEIYGEEFTEEGVA